MAETKEQAPLDVTIERIEVVKANPAYRRLVLIAYALIVAAGFVVFRFLLPMGLSYLGSLGWQQLLVTLRWVFIVMLLCFAPSALYLMYVSRQIYKHDVFPYPGRKVMFDTRVLRGEDARRRARTLMWLGVAFLVLMAISIVYVYVRYTGWLNNPMFRQYLFGIDVVLGRCMSLCAA